MINRVKKLCYKAEKKEAQMSLPKYPILLPSAVALNGDRTDIPTYGTGGSFSYNSGFPSITQTPLSAGGIPPSRADFNGIFHELSQHTFYQQSGGMYAWNEHLDYPLNAVVYGSDNELYKCIQVNGASDGLEIKNPVSSSDYWEQVSIPLSDAINSTSTTIAASSNAVKSAYDRGSTALTEAQKATSKAYVNATNNSNYIKFSNGIIMQWGSTTASSAGIVLTLPISMTSASYSVSLIGVDTSLIYGFWVSERTTTNLKCHTTHSGVRNITWIVIGK